MYEKLGMNQGSMGLDFGSSVKAVKEAGYGCIGTWFDKIAEFGFEKSKKVLLESGLKNNVMCYLGFFNQESEAAYREARAADVQKIKQAADLGAEVVLAVSGPRGAMRQEEAERLLLRSLCELAPVAEDNNVKIALEAIHHMYLGNWTYVTTLERCLRIVNEVGSPSVGLMFDTYHVWQEPGLLDTVKEATGKIVACQINDWRPVTRSMNDRMVPGEGCIPLRTLLDAVQVAGFSSWYDVEIFSDELRHVAPKEFLERCKKGYDSIWK
jgi:sugar phosphate isomerase/epimerase